MNKWNRHEKSNIKDTNQEIDEEKSIEELDIFEAANALNKRIEWFEIVLLSGQIGGDEKEKS